MADVKISELTALTSPDGAEELVVNDGGTTKKITVDNLFNQNIDVIGTVTSEGLVSSGNVTLSKADQRVVTGTSTGRSVISNSSTTAYMSLYGASHASTPNHIDIGAPGNLTVLSGNVGIGTNSPAKPLDVTGDIRTSTGILFGTDTAAANTLDDYETGTWNPVVLNPNVSATHSGYYTKIGDTVHVIGIANLSNNAGSGVMSLAGLPFTANRFAGGVARESGATGVIYFAHTAASSTNIQINTEANGAVSWGSSRTYSFDFTYKTDS